MNLCSSATLFSNLIAQARRPDRWAKALMIAIGTGSVAASIQPAVSSATVRMPMYAASTQRVSPSQLTPATDTTVTCNFPQVQTNSGQDGTAPRVTIVCTGGSSVPNIIAFAVEIKTNTTVAELVERITAGWVLEGFGSQISISSNLSDTSGNAWGCGSANCRKLDYVTGL